MNQIPFHFSSKSTPMRLLGRTILPLTLVSSAVIASSVAQAAGFALREQSAYGQGMSFAGIAAGGAISTSFWNPANISEVESKEFEGILSLIDSESEIRATGASNVIYANLDDTGDVGDTSALPAIYFASRVNAKTAWGLSLTVPFGLGTEADRGTRSQYVGLESSAESFNLTPTLSYAVNSHFNVGIGLMLQKFDVTLTQALPVGATAGRFTRFDPVLELTGDDTAVGYTLGFNYQAGKTAFGLGYRSSIEHEIEGDLTVSELGITSNIRVDLETPSLLTFGVKHQANSKLSLAATVEKADWSSVGILPVINRTTGGVQTLNGRPLALPFAYEDTTYYSVGGEYDYSSKTRLRAGLGYDETTVSANTRTTRLPDNDRYWLSFGGSYQLQAGLQLDLAYTRVWLKDEAEINIGPGHVAFTGLPYSGTADPTVNIVAISLTKSF